MMTNYPARDAYRSRSVAENYESDRFSGWLGRYRERREKGAVLEALGRLGAFSSVLDCPVGTGRWLPLLQSGGARTIGADISAEMLEDAQRRSQGRECDTSLVRADVISLPFRDEAFDIVFCFALFKHLPRDLVRLTLAEFSRVASCGIIVSTPILSGVAGQLWKVRQRSERFALTPSQLISDTQDLGLRVTWVKPCTTPLGVERLVYLDKV